MTDTSVSKQADIGVDKISAFWDDGAMPRIDAPTVAEHSAQRRAAIVDAAVDLLGREGITGVTPAAVASAAGLARSSVYQYFASTDALVAAGVEGSLQRTRVLVDRRQARATPPATTPHTAAFSSPRAQ